MTHATLYDGDTFTAHGLTFMVRMEHDHDTGAPWEECEGHGTVTEADRNSFTRHIQKAPGQRVMRVCGFHGTTWLYDWAEAMKIAQRDAWGVNEINRPANWGSLTAGQQAELAVQADFDYLRGWANNEWSYVGVTVTLLATAASDSLWGVESTGIYSTGIAYEIAGILAEDYLNELAEVAYWASRDVVTH